MTFESIAYLQHVRVGYDFPQTLDFLLKKEYKVVMKLQKNTLTLALALVIAFVFAAGFTFSTAGGTLTFNKSVNKWPSRSDISGKNTIITNNIPVFTRLPLSISEDSVHLRMYNLAPKSCGIPRGYFTFNMVGSNVNRSSYRKLIEETSNKTDLRKLKPNTTYEYKQLLSFKGGACKGVYEGAVRSFTTLVPLVRKVTYYVENENHISRIKSDIKSDPIGESIAPILNTVISKSISQKIMEDSYKVKDYVPVGLKIIPHENRNDSVKVFIQIPENTTFDYSFTASTGMSLVNSDSVELVLDKSGYKIKGTADVKIVSFDIIKNSDYIGKEFFLNTKILESNNIIASKNYMLDTYFVNDSNQFNTERAIHEIDPKKGVSTKAYLAFFLIGIGLLGLIKYVLVPKFENVKLKVPVKK